MEPARVTSTFRSLLTITVIGVLTASTVMLLGAPIWISAFAGALLFVVLDGLLPTSLVRARPRQHAPARGRVSPWA